MSYIIDYDGNYISDSTGAILVDYDTISTNKTIRLNFYSDDAQLLKFFDNVKNYIKQSYSNFVNYLEEV